MTRNLLGKNGLEAVYFDYDHTLVTRPFERAGLVSAFKTLRDHGVHTGVFSSAPHRSVVRELGTFGVSTDVLPENHIVGSASRYERDVIPGKTGLIAPKPSGDGLRYLMALGGVDPIRAAYVGNAGPQDYDDLVAADAGLHFEQADPMDVMDVSVMDLVHRAAERVATRQTV